MGKETFTTEITLTVPSGRFCERKTYRCQFLVGMMNHPGDYCFLLPSSNWEDYQEKRKHPECPSLTQIPKPLKGEGLGVMDRLRVFKDMMGGSPK